MRPDPKAKSYRAQRLIVTLPIALLQQAGDSRGLIHFDPEIPDKRRAAGMLSLGPVVKIVLLFREPFWERSKLKGMSFMHWREGAFRTWWTTLPLRTAVLSGWAGGPVAERLRGLDRREVLDRAITTLSKITSFSSARIRSLLLESHLYDWQADMLSRGAYSYVNVGGQSARAQLARPIEGTLFFAGEATDTSGEAGTVAGALASGHRAARQLLRAMRHRKTAVG